MLKIDNLSNEIEMTAVRGGSQGITQVGPYVSVNSGFGGIVATEVNSLQSASQYDYTSETNNAVNLFGIQNAEVATFKG